MGRIQSNILTAEQIATQMGTASDAIRRATHKSISKSVSTTLLINANAQEANQKALELTKGFYEAFQQGISKIHSVAQEFERMDKELQNNFINSPLLQNSLADMTTYTNAKN